MTKFKRLSGLWAASALRPNKKMSCPFAFSFSSHFFLKVHPEPSANKHANPRPALSLAGRWGLIIITIVLYVGLPVLGKAETRFPKTEQSILHELKAQGFEHLYIKELDEEIIFSIEPGIWKSFSEGARAALGSLDQMLVFRSEDSIPRNKSFRVVFTKQGIPMYSFTKTDLRLGTWTPSYETGPKRTDVGMFAQGTRGYNKLDLVLYSQYAMRNQRLDVLAEYYVSIAPCLEWNPWKGMRVYAQVIIPVINEFGPEYEQIRQGNISAHQHFRIENVFGDLSVGCYTKNRWGVDLSLYRPLTTKGFWSDFRMVGRVGYTGSSSFRDWYWHVGPLNTFTWEVGGSFYYKRMDVKFDLRLERYLAKDLGLRAEAVRYFKRATIGAFAVKNNEGGIDGGFMVAFQIPTYKQKRWGNFFRVTPSTTLDYEYTGAAFFYLGKKHSTYPGDNNAFTQYISPSR